MVGLGSLMLHHFSTQAPFLNTKKVGLEHPVSRTGLEESRAGDT